MGMKYYTKNGDNPRRKPKVLFSCCDSDFDKYSTGIFQQLTEICDCAIYYYPAYNDVVTDDDYEYNLEKMNLVVVPVTAKLLCTANRTMDFDIRYATEHNIPILPLMQEDGLEWLFNQKFGHLQFLQENSKDSTGIPYKDKLELFVKSVLGKNEIANEIHEAFRAKIFLSYRKRDRDKAERLMSLIHEDDRLIDVAFWYDEFLTPGENFDNNILNAINQSDLFLLAVTPNILERPNYVMAEEYPAANGNKPIVSAVLSPIDIEELQKCYPGISTPIDVACNKTAYLDAIYEIIKDHPTRINDVYRKYLIGSAYLLGIDVEKDVKRAIDLLTEAAESGVLDAAKRLVNIYDLGVCVPKDYEKVLFWLNRYVEIADTSFKSNDDGLTAVDYYYALSLAGIICDKNFDYAHALQFYQKMLKTANEICPRFDLPDRLIADSYRDLGMVYTSLGDYRNALRNRKKASDLILRLNNDGQSIETLLCLCDSYRDLSDTFSDLEQNENAIRYMQKAADILRKIVKIRQDNSLVLKLFSMYQTIKQYFKKEGDKKQLRIYKKLEDELFRTYISDFCGDQGWFNIEVAKYYVDRKKLNKAISYTKNAISVLLSEIEKSNRIIDRELLGFHYSFLGYFYFAVLAHSKSLYYYTLAADVFRSIVDECPCEHTYIEYADVCHDLAIKYDKTIDFGKFDAMCSDYSLSRKHMQSVEMAYSYYLQAFELLEKVETSGNNMDSQKKYVDILEDLGRVCKVLNKKEDSKAYFIKCRHLCRILFVKTHSDLYYDKLADVSYQLAIVTRKPSIMEEAYRIWYNLLEKNPKNTAIYKKFKEAKILLERTNKKYKEKGLAEMKDPIEMILDENNNDPIVLYNEDGEAISFEQVAVIPLRGELYVILTPIDKMDGVGEDEALVFVVEEVDGDDVLEIVDDDDIIDEVFEEYYLLLEEDDQ